MMLLSRALTRSAVPAVGGARGFTSTLTHLDPATGLPTMVDVGSKASTLRKACARSYVILPPVVAALLRADAERPGVVELSSAKGPVLTTAIVSGTMAVKQTSSAIPFCHPIPIDGIKFAIESAPVTVAPTADILGTPSVIVTERFGTPSDSGAADASHNTPMSDIVVPSREWAVLRVQCEVSAHHKTGVEMEALHGCAVAALTIYDMCKALSHEIVVSSTRLVAKQGGKRDVVEGRQSGGKQGGKPS